MTLLVVGIGIPHVAGVEARRTRSATRTAEIFSFFISFVVIGYYWLAHHRFFAHGWARSTTRFMQLNLVYLAAIAFMPFPTALVGTVQQPADHRHRCTRSRSAPPACSRR